MNIAPTKGPWHYQEQSDAYTHIVRGPNNEFILSAPQGTSGGCEANARIAAASHELLEALKEMTAFAKRQGWIHVVIQDADAAIAKATRTP